MTTKKEAMEQLKRKRDGISLKLTISPMMEMDNFVSFIATSSTLNEQEFSVKFDPPNPNIKAGIVGYVTSKAGHRTIKVFHSIVDGAYQCYSHTDKRENQFYLYDNFEPLPVYKELEETKKALELSCIRLSGGHVENTKYHIKAFANCAKREVNNDS